MCLVDGVRIPIKSFIKSKEFPSFIEVARVGSPSTATELEGVEEFPSFRTVSLGFEGFGVSAWPVGVDGGDCAANPVACQSLRGIEG